MAVIKLMAAAGVVAGSLWLADRSGLIATSDLASSAKGAAEAVGLSLSLTQAAADPSELPEGGRLTEIYDNVADMAELGEANQKLLAEAERLGRVAASFADAHSAAVKSCNVAERSLFLASSSLDERSRAIADALAEIDAWMLRVIAFAQKFRPLEVGDATLHYRDFGRLRVDIEQSLSSMRSVAATLPRLVESCNLKIPPLRAQDPDR
jgi:hypothetical protein